MTFSIPAEAEWLSSTKHLDNGDYDTGNPMDNQPPKHPVPTMQGAFEESMMETMTEVAEPMPDTRYSKADSISRRKMLLEQEKYERSVAGKWKQKPGEKFHPLWKLVAQISFGMHLLYQGLAKSDEEVIKILQTHVDEVDEFLERTTEDFDLAQNDINERIRYLRLPLDHGQVFDSMLNDRAFRMAIVQGNEKIEHIVNRTAIAMKDALKDVQKGLDATRELARYLNRLERTWVNRSEENDSVYLAMIGNTEGWSRAFMTLQQKGNKLGSALVQLEGIIAEIQRRAGIASRKNIAPTRSMEGKYFVEPKSSTTSSKHSTPPPSSPRKPLPTAPQTISEVVQPTRTHSSALKSPKQDDRQKSALNSIRRPKKRSSKEIVNTVKPPASDKTISIGTVGVNAQELSTKPVNSPSSPTSSKPPGRRVSFKERTHSIARKIPLFKDQEEAESPNSLPIQILTPKRSSPQSTGGSSPMSDPWRLSPLNGQKEKRLSRQKSAPLPDSSSNQPEKFLTESGQTPTDTSFSPLEYPRSANSPTSSLHSLHSVDSKSGHTTVLVATHKATEGRLVQAHPLLRDIRVKEVRFSTTAPGSPLKPTIRDLPLRHYHSQDALPLMSDRNNQQKGPIPPKRTSSLSAKHAPSFSPLTGSSVYSPKSQPSTELPIQGQSSATYSPEELSASLYSDSPLTTGQTLPPAQSSAAPSPLRVRLKNDLSEPKSAPPELTRLPLPALSPTASPSDATPPPIALRKDVPTSTSAVTRDAATATNDDSNNEAESEDEILLSATLHQASFAPSPSSHKHKMSDTSLIDYLVSTPASASPIPAKSIASSTQASAKTSTTTASAKYRMLQLHSKPISSPVTRAPISIPTTPRSHMTDDAHPHLDRHNSKISPWRKVFGTSNSSSTSTPHRRSKSEKEKVIIIPTKKLEELRSKHRKGNASTSDAGFLGMGKDGVWISRKNFLKA